MSHMLKACKKPSLKAQTKREKARSLLLEERKMNSWSICGLYDNVSRKLRCFSLFFKFVVDNHEGWCGGLVSHPSSKRLKFQSPSLVNRKNVVASFLSLSALIVKRRINLTTVGCGDTLRNKKKLLWITFCRERDNGVDYIIVSRKHQSLCLSNNNKLSRLYESQSSYNNITTSSLTNLKLTLN